MRVLSVEVDGFRNLQQVRMKPAAGRNLILGNNGQGKTNLLEAIWVCTGCRSFRGSKEREYLCFRKPALHIKLKFEDSRRTQNIEIHMARGEGRQKKILLNGVPLKGGGGLFSQFQCVSFSPDDRGIIREGPERRRAFLDLCGSQVTPGMLHIIQRFGQLTEQRNAVLKQIAAGRAKPDDLLDWNFQLAVYGSALICMRYAYCQELAAASERIYDTITGGSELMELQYRCNLFRNEEIPPEPTDEMHDRYLMALQRAIPDDVRLGFTTKGAGRDDFICRINQLSVREFGSQGQQKSTALALKLAQASVFYASKDETPVILLDDVMGELDVTRQRLVYDMIKDMQIFLTTPQPESVIEAIGENAFYRMDNGVLTKL